MDFVENSAALEKYKDIKPVKIRDKMKLCFICPICHNESVKTYKSLAVEFICSGCKIKRVQSSPEVRSKTSATNIKKYGCKSPTQNKEIQRKQEETTMLHYGVRRPGMSEIVRKKCEETCLNKYGVSNVSSLESTRKAVIETVQQKYGVNNVFQSDEFLKKRQSIHNENLDSRLTGLNLKFLYKKDERITLLCLNCNNTFSYAPAHFYRLLDSETKSFCPICSRIIEPNSSLQEKSLLEYIKSIYTGKILENDRQALNGRELDIYLPEKKMAIEFDGTYWHADPRFYSADFMIMGKSASEIWKRDNEKNELCHIAGISLLRINEYDWLTNRQIMEDCVSKFISAVNR